MLTEKKTLKKKIDTATSTSFLPSTNSKSQFSLFKTSQYPMSICLVLYLEGEYGGGGWVCKVLTGNPGITIGS